LTNPLLLQQRAAFLYSTQKPGVKAGGMSYFNSNNRRSWEIPPIWRFYFTNAVFLDFAVAPTLVA
jgi:hypothetical protein